MSSIEWTDVTWNPVTGCDRVSPGCDNCYAATMARRLKAMGQPRYQTDGDPRTSGPGFGVAVHDDVLEPPLRWRKPRRVFVNSMSDLFHPAVPDEFIAAVFAVMDLAHRHTFQVLTKRPRRMRALLASDGFLNAVAGAIAARDPDPERADRRAEDPTLIRHYTPPRWPLPNVWLGTSVEDQQRADERIPPLLDTPAAVRFLSCEPLLGPVDLQYYLGVEYLDTLDGWGHEMFSALQGRVGGGLHWIIVGGESGRRARPMHPAWARQLRDQAEAAEVPFFFKQWGEWRPSERGNNGDLTLTADDRVISTDPLESMSRVGGHGGRWLDGRIWDEFPEAVTADA